MGREGDEAIDKLVDAFRVLIIGAVLIYAAYSIIQSLLTELPIWIQYTIYGLLIIFVILSRNKIKEFTEDILKPRKRGKQDSKK